jgi:hypothetical protein
MKIEATFTRRVEQTATGQENIKTQWEFESESSSSDNISWMVVELRKLREQALAQIEQFTKSSVGERDEYPLEEELEEEELPPLNDESPKKKKQKK